MPKRTQSGEGKRASQGRVRMAADFLGRDVVFDAGTVDGKNTVYVFRDTVIAEQVCKTRYVQYRDGGGMRTPTLS
jgi:hypothetical protein